MKMDKEIKDYILKRVDAELLATIIKNALIETCKKFNIPTTE